MMKVGTKIIVVIIVVAGIAALLTFGRGRRNGVFYAMGGVPINVVAYGRSQRDFNGDLAAVETRVDELEGIYSRYRVGSPVGRLNNLGVGCLEDANPELERIIERSRRWSVLSDGAFDITVGSFVTLWKIAEKENRMPTENEIKEARARVGMKNVRVAYGRVCIDQDGASLDLGAIAKGAVMDSAADLLVARGVKRGVIEAGGDIAAFGPGTFKIGIQDPTRSRGELMGRLSMSAGGVVTSGDYERYVTIGGKNYSHIIDPRTGWPVDTLISVTVIGPNATDADALATAVSVMGREDGIKLVRGLQGYEIMLIEKTEEGEFSIWCSEDLRLKIDFSEKWKNIQVNIIR